MTDSVKLKVLIIYPVNVVAELVRFSLESEYNCQADIANNLKAGKGLCLDGEYPIILAANIFPDEDIESFYHELIDANKIRYFFLITNNNSINSLIYKNCKPNGLIPEKQLLEILGKHLNEILSKTSDTPDEWTKISLIPLTYFDAIPEDIYILLLTGRFIKLFSRGDKITMQDVERYNKKGVTKLFLKKQAYQWLIKQIDSAIPKVIAFPDAPIVTDGAEENVVFTDEAPKLDGPMKLPKHVIKEVHQASNKILLQIKKNKELSKLLSHLTLDRTANQYLKNRIDLVCNIACAIAHELSWTSDAMYEKLIYLAYTHDLALLAHPKLLKVQTKVEFEFGKFSDEEMQLILNHPFLSADLVKNDLRAPPDAEQIIRQHHERPKAGGFPLGLPIIRILPTAALLTVSIDFAQYILDHPNWNYEQYSKHAIVFRGGTFTKIIKALEDLCRGHI